jgi:hypothetical protein
MGFGAREPEWHPETRSVRKTRRHRENENQPLLRARSRLQGAGARPGRGGGERIGRRLKGAGEAVGKSKKPLSMQPE